MVLELHDELRNVPLGNWSVAKLPPEILHEIFICVYDLKEALPSVCDYIFPQSWWLDAIKNVKWMKGWVFPPEQFVYNWERLARDISRIPESYFPGIDGLRNRKRIWKVISSMRRNDMFDMRTRYCTCSLSRCRLWEFWSDDWCGESWTEYKISKGYPEDWVPTIGNCIEWFAHDEEDAPFLDSIGRLSPPSWSPYKPQ